MIIGSLDLEDLSSPTFTSGRDVNGMLWKRVASHPQGAEI